MSISLVITTYNQQRYLKEAIASILAQTRGDFELLIWDDGSTDSSVEVAREYAAIDSRIRVIAAKHQGRGLALKDAIAATTGTYISWIDHDDQLAPTALEETAGLLDAQPEIGLVYTDYVEIDENGDYKGYGKRCRIPYSKDRLLIDFMTFHFRLMRRSVFEQVGGIDPEFEYIEDYDLCLRLSEATEVQHIKKPLYLYRIHAQNTSHSKWLEQIVLSHKAITKALERRGLADTLEAVVTNGKFSLRRKELGRQEELPHLSSLSSFASYPAGSRYRVYASLRFVKKATDGSKSSITPLKKACALLAAIPLINAIGVNLVQAQPIVPAGDGTNTIVTPNGNRIDITGGQTSKDGANLFHTFTQFNVNTGGIVNFQSLPEIRNILGRINGGDVSRIDGLIQVLGSNANLFLMNPAGIIFGPNASLNVPASFFATTANGIGFGNNWFNATGVNNYADLVGTPNSFAFTMPQPGAIFNAGNLAVGMGQTLGLVGGTVINTGQLTASSGQLIVASVPGESLVQLSQPGFVLSLMIQPPNFGTNQPNKWTLPILSLPQLLTGGSVGNATGVTVNNDGSVQLIGSGIRIPTDPGTTIVAGTVDASATQANGGEVHILGEKVGLVGANINASGTNGGTVLIGGDYQGKGTVPNASRTFVSQDSVISVDSFTAGNGGRGIVWADKVTEFYGTISAKGGSNSGNGGFIEVSGKETLVFKGTADTSAPKGENGTLLLDPSTLTIIDAAGGGTQDTNISGDGLILSGDPNLLSNTISWGAIDALAPTTNVALEATGDITINDVTGSAGGNITAPNLVQLDLTTGSLRITSTGGSIRFVDPADTIRTSGGSITLQAQGGAIAGGILDTTGAATNIPGNIIASSTSDLTLSAVSGGGVISLTSGGNITANQLNSFSTTGSGGAIALTANNSITTGDINAWSINGTGGPIVLTANNGSITTGNINSFSTFGNGGVVNLNATGGGITAGNINTSSAFANGGPISLIATGDIVVGTINTAHTGGNGYGGDGGPVSIDGNNVTVGTITTSSANGNGGVIAITADGNILTSSLNTSSVNNGVGGAIAFDANGNITVSGTINTTAVTGNAGAVNLTGANGNLIVAGDINASSTNGVGGAIALTGNNIAPRNITTNDNNITLTGPVNLTADTTFTSTDTGGNITFSSTIDGTQNLTLLAGSGTVQLGGAVGGTTPLNTVTVTAANTNVANNITTANGNITFNSPVNLTGSSTINAGTATILFNSTVAASNNPLALTAGEINWNGAVTGSNTLTLQPGTAEQNITLGGAGNAPAALDITSTELQTLANGFSSITIGRPDGSGAITVVSPVIFNDPVTIQSPTGAGSITATSSITGLDDASITLIANQNIFTNNITASGDNITITSNSGAIDTSTGTLNSSNPGGSGGAIALSAPLSITAAGIDSTGNPGTGDISLTSNLINFTGATNSVRGNGTLLIQPFTPSQDLQLTAADLTALQNGFTSITIGRENGSGTITLPSPITFSDPVTVRSPSGAIVVNGTLTGLDNASITLTGNTTLNANITTAENNITINGNTLLGTDVTLSTGAAGGGDILFNGAISGNRQLLLTAGTGNVEFNGNIAQLTRLEVNAQNAFLPPTNNLIISTNNGDIIFNSGVIVRGSGGSVTFDAGTATVALNGGLTAGNNSVTLTADEINLGGAIAGNNTLVLQPTTATRAIAIGGAIDSGTETLDLTNSDINALQDGFSSITIGRPESSGLITVPNDVTFKDPVTIQTPTGTGAIAATGTITGINNASINLRANSNITTSNIIAPAGITITSTNGAIDSSKGRLDTSNNLADGGVINLNAAGNITADTIISAALLNPGKGGDISLTSGGIITAGNINASAANGIGGQVTLNAPNNITTGNIVSNAVAGAGGNITVNSQTGEVTSGNLNASGTTQGGNITVTAQIQIRTGQINSSASIGNGGNVTLDPLNDIEVEFINAQGGNSGSGGTVDITTGRFFRATGSFTDRTGLQSSISTAGGTGGGSIIIRHSGGDLQDPIERFIVGNPAINGTAAAINSGEVTIQVGESFPRSSTRGNIGFVTDDGTDPIPPEEPEEQSNFDQTRILTDLEGETESNIQANNNTQDTVTSSAALDTTEALRENIAVTLRRGDLDKAVLQIEQLRRQEFTNYFGGNLFPIRNNELSLEEVGDILSLIADRTGKKPAVIYVLANPEQLDLVLVTPNKKSNNRSSSNNPNRPIHVSVPAAKRDVLLKAVTDFRIAITDPDERYSDTYKAAAQQLYQWLIKPLEVELQARGIDNIAFSMDPGLRSLPVAALYDGQQFLVEKYSLGLIPSMSLTDTRLGNIKEAQVLAMGASEFKELNPLPAVPVEVSTITKEWSGRAFLNETFTLGNLKSQRSRTPYGIIHLATHGEFKPGTPDNSFIQLWNSQLKLTQLRQMGWNNPPVELLVLSACRTALGDEEAELGFAGLAVASGAKTALGSLWYVSDEATLGLMTELYQQLKNAAIKADAVQQAQIAMIKGQVRLQGGQLQVPGLPAGVSLPPVLAEVGDKTLEHPYYWSGFTMIGSPW